jgi:hypothetical protein
VHEGELRHTVGVVVGRGERLEVTEEFGKSFAFKVVLKVFFILG